MADWGSATVTSSVLLIVNALLEAGPEESRKNNWRIICNKPATARELNISATGGS